MCKKMKNTCVQLKTTSKTQLLKAQSIINTIYCIIRDIYVSNKIFKKKFPVINFIGGQLPTFFKLSELIIVVISTKAKSVKYHR